MLGLFVNMFGMLVLEMIWLAEMGVFFSSSGNWMFARNTPWCYLQSLTHDHVIIMLSNDC